MLNNLLVRCELSFMVVTVALIIILSILFDYNLLFTHYVYSTIIFWILVLLSINFKIVDNRLNELLFVVPLSFALPGTFSYFNLIDKNLVLGISYLLLMSYALILYGNVISNKNLDVKINKKLFLFNISPLLAMVSLLPLIGMLGNLREIGLTNIVFFVIAGPIIEGVLILLTIINGYKKLLLQGQLSEIATLANILFVSIAVSLNVILVLLSITGNSLKVLLGFRIGIVLDYLMRAAVLVIILMGVSIYA